MTTPQWIIEDLARSGLTVETFPVTPLKSEGELTRRLGFSKMGEVSILKIEGYWIPYPNVPGFNRLKLREPINGAKYLSPKDGGNHPFILLSVLEVVKDYKPDTPIFITEGEKKCVKATLEGFRCIGLSGVWNWKDGENDFLPELENLNFKHRTVYNIFDSDIIGKVLVRQAELRLAVELMNRGAKVMAVRLPNESSGEKNGVDDYLERHGREVFEKLIKDARPVFETQINEYTPVDLILKEAAGIASVLEREKIVKLVSQREDVDVVCVREEAAKHVPKAEHEASESKSEKRSTGTSLTLEDPEPWHEPVNGSDLLNNFAAKLSSHMSMGTYAETVCALWALLTWVYDSFDILPLLVIHSPEKGCGKTTLLDVLSRFVARPLPASSITASGLFRTIEVTRPCLLIDEADSFMHENEELRGVINCGHMRSGSQVIRCVGQRFEPRAFSTWCPKALSGLGRLPGTIEDRSFIIELARLAPGETVSRLRYRDQWPDLGRQAARWAKDNAESLSGDDTELPDYLSNRDADNWSVLFLIAQAAGGDWPQRVEAAARHYTSTGDSNSLRIELLHDIKQIFEDAKTDRIPTTELIEPLIELEERPWGEWRRGQPMTARQLSSMLKPFHIASTTFRVKEGTAKGYKCEQFDDAFRRYLPTPPSQKVTREQMNNDRDLGDSQSVTQDDNVTDRNNPNPPESLECYRVTDRNPPIGEGDKEELQFSLKNLEIVEQLNKEETKRAVDIPGIRLSDFERRGLAVEIYSEPLGCNLWLCSNKEMGSRVKRDDPDAVCYTTHELRELIKLNPGPEGLNKIHSTKSVFPGSTLKSVTPYEVPEVIREDQKGEDTAT